MRRIFTTVLPSLILLFAAQAGFAQKKGNAIGFSANLVDFSGKLPEVGKLDPGFSVMYWQGITNKIDYSIRYNGLFSDYSKRNATTGGYINEFEAALHARPINDNHLLAPFATAGIGVGAYGGGYWATYVPVGIGLQLNMADEGYIFLQGNYRISLNYPNLDNNTMFSLGFTQTIHPARQKKVAELPQPPVVVVTDRDNDGVPDSVDACPDVAGLPKFNGCPDTDGDGIPDKDDKCPTVAGVAKYQGCPIPDTDGDGINDEEDKCPTVPGVAKYQGCPVPDRDHDGVPDDEDRCPDVAGDPANHGCPIVKEEVKKKAEYAAQHLYFATGSHQLLKKSFVGLDDLAAILKSDPNLKLAIDGYTDNTGKAETNQVLSEKRAGTIKKYLVTKGIAESRIEAKGHGATDFVADNKTAAGRAKNRRVEMKLDY